GIGAGRGMTGGSRILFLRADQRTRWLRGERVRVEAYREQEPALRDDPEGFLDLVYHEILLRQEEGSQPALDEYVRRFPELEESLRLLFDVHKAVEAGVTT